MNNAEDELAIRRVLANYCRGLDRMDKPLALSVFHENAPATYIDMYEGTGHGFIDWAWDIHSGMERHSHQITNVIVDIEGDRAVSEAYATVALWTLPDENNKQQEIIARGRYLDRWAKRDQRWAIAERTHVLDMQTVSELNKADVNEVSRRDAEDASFKYLV